MKLMTFWKRFFEYFFYRIAKLNLRFTKPDRAITSVTAVQFSIIMNIFLAIYLMLFPNIKRNFTIYEILALLAVFFTIDYFNTRIYKGRFEEFDKRWNNEPRSRKVVGMFVVIGFIIFSLGLIFINGLIFDRYKTY